MPTVRLFKVGADPEFGFLNSSGDLVEASSVITMVRSKFGLDGCAAIAEMRPDPSINPSQVVRNLYNDLLNGYYLNPKTRDLYWKAGSVLEDSCDIYATGGHIHFGIHNSVPRRHYGNRLDYYKKLTKYLDTYLAQTVRLLETPKQLGGRIDGEYGQLGDQRENSHGVEYRVLGSWLTSPRIAEGVLCLAQTIAYQHMWLTVNRKDINLDRLSPEEEADEYGEGSEYSDAVPDYIRDYRKKFNTLSSHIRKFQLYKKHELPIEFVLKLVEKRKTWYPGEGVDMKQAWGIAPAAIIPPRSAGKVLPVVKYDDIWKRARN